MLDGLAGGQLVEDPVGELLAGVQAVAGSPGRRSWSSQAATVSGPVGRGEGVVEGLQLRADLPVLVAEQARAAAAAPRSGRIGRRGCGRAARSPGSCARSRGQGGCRPSRAGRRGCRRGSARPDRSARTGSSAACRPGTTACRWLRRSRTGLSGRRLRRSGSSTARQFAHSGPPGARTLTGRRRPQPAQVSWLAGSVIRQWGHSGRPCSSRAATCADRSAPRARLRRGTWPRSCGSSHCPSIRRCRWMTRPQRGHGGATMPVRAGLAAAVDQPQHRRHGGLGAGAGEQLGLDLAGPRPAGGAARTGRGRGMHRADHGLARAASGRSRRRSRR